MSHVYKALNYVPCNKFSKDKLPIKLDEVNSLLWKIWKQVGDFRICHSIEKSLYKMVISL